LIRPLAETHRLLPALARMEGARIGEIAVHASALADERFE
jgi:hypothetical protein